MFLPSLKETNKTRENNSHGKQTQAPTLRLDQPDISHDLRLNILASGCLNSPDGSGHADIGLFDRFGFQHWYRNPFSNGLLGLGEKAGIRSVDDCDLAFANVGCFDPCTVL